MRRSGRSGRSRRSGWLVTALLLAMVSAGAIAQEFDREERADPKNNIPYDGRFVFARIKYRSDPRGWDQFGRPDLKWDHDYPTGEQNFTRILRELTTLRPFVERSNILTLDDPELYKYPLAYMAEPGYWVLNDAEALGLRNYLLKGGFIIFDDFQDQGVQWMTFVECIGRVLPGARLVELDASHPIFDSFYRIDAPHFQSPYGPPPVFYGIFENNDPSQRLMVIANFNNDLSEYWEYSATGAYPVSLSNEAYKLGVNYIIYGMTR